MLEIILIILCSIIIILLIVGIIIFIKKKNTTSNSSFDMKEIWEIQKNIKDLSNNFNKEIELSMTKSSKLISEDNNDKLERFQNNINKTLNERIDAINTQMAKSFETINNKVDERLEKGFSGTSETIAQVRERLQAIDAAQKNIENLSKDVVSLKSVLEGNQTRGIYGEYQLSMVLNHVFGDTTGCYEEQYVLKKVKDGDDVRPDAVVFMPEPNKMICIDSKFPFMDYQRMIDSNDEDEKEKLKKEFAAQVKKHITVIKDKYIVDGKTAPEAIMFIPNDGVFAFIHHDLEDVVEYAREKRVILTSPSTLPAILVTINMVRIEVERAKNAKEINKQLQKLGKDFEMFAREWDKFSSQLEKATRTREALDVRVNKINNKFDSIKGSNPMIEEKDTVEEVEDNENN